MTKTREKTNLTVSMMTSKPDCEAALVGEGQYRLVPGGTLQISGDGGKEVQRGEYCVDRGSVRVCKESIKSR